MSLRLRLALALAVAALLGLGLQGVCQAPLPVARPPPAATQTVTPSATPTATPTPTLPAYRVTYYGEGFRGGPLWCEAYGYYDPDDPTTAASGVEGFGCGTRLELCSSDDRCLTVVVKDRCGGCGERHIDVSPAAWRALGRPDYVTVRVLAEGVEATAVRTLARTGGERLPPVALTGGDFAALPVRPGLTINRSGCASDGKCWGFNAYWWPTNEIVMIPGEPYYKEAHERCHAHQAWAIGRDLSPSEYDLHPWYDSQEGQTFMSEIGVPDPWPFSHSAISGLESFAWVCGFYYADSQQLYDLCQVCYDWASRNLP